MKLLAQSETEKNHMIIPANFISKELFHLESN